MAYNAELQMLRELAYWILPQLSCHFCSEPLMTQKEGERQGFGHRRHRKVHVVITFHHRDENRSNNSILDNVKIAHPHCHRKYHNKGEWYAEGNGREVEEAGAKEGPEGQSR